MPDNSTADNGKDAAREARRQIADHKGAWRNRLLADRRVSNAAKVVGCAIAEHINRASKEAKVGVRRLALILHMSQSQVSKAVHELADARLLEVEWGVQGGRNNASIFKLVIDLKTPDLFLFNKYELADFVEAENGVLPAELGGVLPAELGGVLKTGRSSSKKGPVKFTKKARQVLPGEQNPVLTPGNPGGTPGVGTTDDARDSIPTNSATTSDDATDYPLSDTVSHAPVPATDRPVARPASEVAGLKQPVAEQNQQTPSSASKNIGRPAMNSADADADAERAAVFERGRKVLGAGSDALVARLLDAERALDALGAADRVIDALNAAANEDDPHAHIENEIALSQRLQAAHQ